MVLLVTCCWLNRPACLTSGCCSGYATQAAAEADARLIIRPVRYYHTGGYLGVALGADAYSSKVAGETAPSFARSSALHEMRRTVTRPYERVKRACRLHISLCQPILLSV